MNLICSKPENLIKIATDTITGLGSMMQKLAGGM